jgi:ATP-binding cassette subfamily B protein
MMRSSRRRPRAAADRRPPVWRTLWRLARGRPRLTIVNFALWILFYSIPLLIGLVLKRVFDALGDGAPAGLGVYALIGVLVAAEFARLLNLWHAVRAFFPWWYHIGSLLQLNMLRAQVASGGAEAATLPGSPGEAVNRFRDDVDDTQKLLDNCLDAAGATAFMVIGMAVMASIDPIVTVAVVLPLVAMVVVTQALTGRIRAYRRADRRATAAVSGFLGELFGSVLAVKASNAEAAVLRRLAALNDRRRHTSLRDQLCTDLLDSYTATTVDLSIGLVLLLAAAAIRRGDFTIGDLTLFVSYTGYLVQLPRYTGRLLARHRQVGVSVDRMTRMLAPGTPAKALTTLRPLYLSGRLPAAPVPDPGLARPAALLGARAGGPAGRPEPLRSLQVRGLTATHPGAGGDGGTGQGVRDVTFTCERGTLTVISGPVGAGKTTLLRALLGLVPSQAGAVAWNGEPIADLAGFMTPPCCAYVPQVPHLFSESLADNLLLGMRPADADLDGAVRRAVLDVDVEAMPDRLDTLVGARGVRLSGGQAQRAATARALTRGADLLILDDVSSALDVDTERQLWDRLLADRGTTYLVVSNRPATIARADQALRMDHGTLVPFNR